MISETRNRSSRYILIGLVVAVVSAIFVVNMIGNIRESVIPPPTPTPETLLPVLYAAADIGSQQKIEDLLTASLPEIVATDAEPQAEEGEDPAADALVAVGGCPAETPFQSPILGLLQVCMIPVRFVPPGSVTLELFINEGNIFDDAAVRAVIIQTLGDEFTQMNIAQGSAIQEAFLDVNVLDPGFVEVSIGVNTVTSVGGRVRPGQRVDIIVSYERGSGNDTTTVTEMLLQNVAVVAVASGAQQLEAIGQGQYIDPSSGAAFELFDTQRSNFDTSVVLALRPEEARDLVYMSNFAREVRLLIRRPGDETIYDIAPITLIE